MLTKAQCLADMRAKLAADADDMPQKAQAMIAELIAYLDTRPEAEVVAFFTAMGNRDISSKPGVPRSLLDS